MFAWWAQRVIKARWAVLAAGLALAIFGVSWGTGVFGAMVNGGFDDPNSESTRAAHRIVAELGRQDFDLIVLYSSATATVDDPAFRDAVTSTVDKLRKRSEVTTMVTFYDTRNPALISRDHHATYAAIRSTEPNDASQLESIRADASAPGLRTEIGGTTAIFSAVSDQVSQDIARAELYSMPILLLLLAFVFGSLVAATTPLLVGGLTILGAFVATRLLTYTTDISIFALNIITLLGLGLAIDYSLFVVSRFREELAARRSTSDAVVRTMTTAGRTVAVSGLTVALALSSLLLFPQVFLRSMGLGGMAAVLVAMLVSLTVLPALLAVLGPRVDAVRIGLPRRGVARTEGAWARIAHAVMRRPVVVLVGTVLVLGVLASPFTRVRFGGIDERVLPPGTESRVVGERIEREFPGGGSDHISVLLSGADAATATAFVAQIRGVPEVVDAAVTAIRGNNALISVAYPGAPGGRAAQRIVTDVRNLPAPQGAQVLVGGQPANLVDLLSSLRDRLPWMALLVAASTMVLLFLAFGSVLLPIKALVMNVVSIGASFGAVVWVFQDGHLSNVLGFTSTGDLEATQLILMLAILFGLSTDYELFLLSRVREEWDRTGDNTAAVAAGMQRTGRIITSAALLLVIVIGGFATGGILFIKMIGLGMIVAITVDATIVRGLMVPATMRLLGRANWWAPGPLARLYRRHGISEEPGLALASETDPAPQGLPEPVAR